MIISKDQLAHLETRYRAQLVNSVSGFKSANLVGTIDNNGLTNLSIVSSVIHLGSNPPLLGMVFRPHSVPRHTLENILETGVYTINHVNNEIFKKAHQTSARYPKTISEFEACNLTPIFHGTFIAPFVQESSIRIAMEYREHQTLKLNETVFLVGEILHIELPEEIVAATGYVDLEVANTVCVSGLDSYHNTQRLAQLPYAKPI
ncbi:flavin reductase family protein (plasmid) [Pseudoalteromonas xiamenensis]|uniref:flavin reductase family protein n=1 Tax=Pseudoalteromonas xiamenensis TaxID=882626 RepID=UPI0027E3BE14|nr:flavin reductase [Pseudoalteromonas xiamenensis]WMN62219.1 flavin reductase family protein [Pseudoalteromonas xiamenensis]